MKKILRACFISLVSVSFFAPVIQGMLDEKTGEMEIVEKKTPDTLVNLCIARIKKILPKNELALPVFKQKFLMLPRDLQEPVFESALMPFFRKEAWDSYHDPKYLIKDRFSVFLSDLDHDSYKKICYLILFSFENSYKNLKYALIDLLEKTSLPQNEITFLNNYKSLVVQTNPKPDKWKFDPFYIAFKAKDYALLNYLITIGMPNLSYQNYETPYHPSSILEILKYETPLDDLEMQEYLTKTLGVQFY